MKKFIILALLALLLVSAQCSISISSDVPSLVYSDFFDYNQGWNEQNVGNFTAYIDYYSHQLQMNLNSIAREGYLYVPLSNWNSLSDTYSIQVDTRLDNSGDATALILFNYIDNLNHDAFQFDQSGAWRLVRFENGNPTYNEHGIWNYGLKSAGYTNTIVISQHSNRIDLIFNGSYPESVYLSSLGRTVAVELGIRGTTGGTVYYDNLYLSRLDY